MVGDVKYLVNGNVWNIDKQRVLAHGGPFATWWSPYEKIRIDLKGGGCEQPPQS